jgi:hypothetical protein
MAALLKLNQLWGLSGGGDIALDRRNYPRPPCVHTEASEYTSTWTLCCS